MPTSQQKLQNLLRQLFRTDAADLDFGIYRIINYRRNQIQAFVDEELPTLVNNTLDANTEIESERKEFESLRKQIPEGMLDADDNPIDEAFAQVPIVKKFLEAKEKRGGPQPRNQREDVVFNHLYTFFSRYYENGDFIPRRRYSQTERYAVPYNGEEVYLHWANRDQYYVKSGEHFSTYRFKSQGVTVTFNLRDVDIEKDNVKGTKRFFVPLSAETTYSSETNEVCIPFEYRPLTDRENSRYGNRDQQDKIINTAEPEIIGCLTDHYKVLSALEHQTEGETTLKKHLRTYTRRNTADFFIHKDLRGFLNRELDVYLKNDVIPLSDLILTDVNFELTAEEVNPCLTNSNNWLEIAKLVHDIAAQIIDFLAHIEEFQKMLWLKKKFVLSTDYCLTLDRIPEKFYPEIAQNASQREEWKHLFAIHEIDNNLIDADYTEPLSIDFLKENPNLVLDTCHFTPDFKDRLLAHFDDLDNLTDGLLIHGENFQSLNLLREKYRGALKTIYIDPPYNTKGSAILYKNNYKDSSWLSLLADRVAISRELLAKDGIFCAAIDDAEAANLRYLLQNIFGKETEQGIVSVCSNPGGRQTPTGFSPAHEYAMFFSITKEAQISPIGRTEEQLKSYNQIDSDGKHFKWMPLLKGTDASALRELRPRLFYPIFVRNDQIRIPRMEWNKTKGEYDILELAHSDEIEVLPLRPKDGKEMRWRHKIQTLEKKMALSEVAVRSDRNGKIKIEIKSYPKDEGIRPKTWWDKKAYSATSHGTTFLNNMLGDNDFSFPKSIYLVEDCLRVSSLGKDDILLDYFGGSGTTAHATLNLNRQDGGKRKYILIEMGHHFETVLKPRVKKAVYAEKWKDAKPVSRESRLSHIIKYQRIESYEDSLNNIQFTEREKSLFEEPLLSYLLGSETRESPTFLDVPKLRKPFNYQLNIVKDMQTQKQSVDLPETFNYLLGITVKTRQCLNDDDRCYLVYRGKVEQKTVVVIWRETAGWEQQDWERDYNFVQENKIAEGAEEIYVNTDSIIPDAKSLDPLFKRLMFSQ